MTQRIGIGWRTAAALAAMVVLLPLLVFVDIQPSAAHRQTTQRCDYDPWSGQQFNCRNVPVPHRHTSNNSAPPPDTSPKPPKCPTGTTGTPPDCQPIPSDNSRSGNNQNDDPPPTTT